MVEENKIGIKRETKLVACKKYAYNDTTICNEVEVNKINPLEFIDDSNLLAVKYVRYDVTYNSGTIYQKEELNETPWIWYGKRITSAIKNTQHSLKDYCFTKSGIIGELEPADLTISEYEETLKDTQAIEQVKQEYANSLEYIKPDKRLEWKEFFNNCYTSLNMPFIVQIMQDLHSVMDYREVLSKVKQEYSEEKRIIAIKIISYFTQYGNDFGNYFTMQRDDIRRKHIAKKSLQ